MKPLQYLKNNGIKHAFDILYQYKVDLLIQKIMKPILKNKPLQDVIVIESHNDFDCNGGAFFQFLINNGYNKKYKIVWLLKHPELKRKDLPDNVLCVPLFKPSIKKNYYICVAKFFTADNTVVKKVRKEQKSFYFDHGAGGFKNIKGLLMIPNHVDYILMESESYAPIQADQYSIEYPSERFLYLGYPVHDVLNSKHPDELKKITDKTFEKVIIWMPTFRKGGGFNRDDSGKEQPLGIPLINDVTEYQRLNDLLREKNALLIIKIHPMQDLNALKIKNLSNITVLTGKDVKNKDIDNYRLMGCTDALISDYSGVAYDYLQLNKPIGYVLDDMEDYKLGFVVDDIHQLIAGKEIYTSDDLESFIMDIVNDKDDYKERRKQIRDYIYKYYDTNNCKRLVEFMGL